MSFNCEECGKPIWHHEEYSFGARGMPYIHGRKLCNSCREKYKKEYEREWERLKQEEEKHDKWRNCSNCNGSGKIKGYDCQKCNGKGKIKSNDYNGRTCNDAFRDFYNEFPEWWDKK
jgi:RecJ-like exonuclease